MFIGSVLNKTLQSQTLDQANLVPLEYSHLQGELTLSRFFYLLILIIYLLFTFITYYTYCNFNYKSVFI